MIKHAQGSSPSSVTGQLLGLDDDGRVEVTHAYGMPSSEDDLQFINAEEFQHSMITNLGHVGSQVSADSTRSTSTVRLLGGTRPLS